MQAGPTLKPSEGRSGIGAEYEAGPHNKEDELVQSLVRPLLTIRCAYERCAASERSTRRGWPGLRTGPAEEQTCAWGRGMRLLKIETRMRGRDDVFRMGLLKRDFE